MKSENHATSDLRKLGELTDGFNTAMLTTHASGVSLVSRPLRTLACESSGKQVFFTDTGSHKFEEMADNPDVNLCDAHPTAQRYRSIRGRARVDRDRKTIDEFWSSPQKLSFPQGKDDPNLIVLRIRLEGVAYWESPGNVIARAQNFAKGMLSNTPQGLGKHGMLNGDT